jgi:glycosyltransferase involved in cell wall biosynthesis
MTGINHKTELRTILYIATGLDTGGAEIMLYNLITTLDREKYIPVVISLIHAGDIAKRLNAKDIKVHSLEAQPGKLPSVPALMKLIQLVHNIKPAIIHGWMYHGNFAALFARFFSGKTIPLVWTIHHSVESLNNEKAGTSKIIKLGAKFSRSPSAITYVSSISKKQHELLGYSNQKSLVIPNGVDVDLFVPSLEHYFSVRQELQLPQGSFLIGLIARFHPMKDHENFLKAAALISAQFNNIYFILAGTSVDNDNAFLKGLIWELHLKNIFLLGKRDDTDRLMAALDILTISSSHGEAFPMVLLEAMSCGVLCVSASVGDAQDIIGETGKIVPVRDPASLANACKELITSNEHQRKKLGKIAREKVITDYSLKSVVKKYEELYGRIM